MNELLLGSKHMKKYDERNKSKKGKIIKNFWTPKTKIW